MLQVGVVLGGTRGIGLALVEALARLWGDRGLVYLTARDESTGIEKVDAFKRQGLNVELLAFDLADPESPDTLAMLLEQRHGGLDVVVQDGAYMARADVSAEEDARPMIEANSHGTLRVLRSFAPLLRPNGRMLVVASGFGVLSSLPEELRAQFDTKLYSPEEINERMDAYVEAVESGCDQQAGWPAWVNIPSKVGQVAVTRAFARRQRTSLAEGVLINAACPGVTLTDATRDYMGTVFRPEDAQTPQEAAAGLLRWLTLPAGSTEPYAELVQHGVVLPFGD